MGIVKAVPGIEIIEEITFAAHPQLPQFPVTKQPIKAPTTLVITTTTVAPGSSVVASNQIDVNLSDGNQDNDQTGDGSSSGEEGRNSHEEDETDEDSEKVVYLIIFSALGLFIILLIISIVVLCLKHRSRVSDLENQNVALEIRKRVKNSKNSNNSKY